MAQKLATVFIFGLLALAYAGIVGAGSYTPAGQPYGPQVNPVYSYNASGSNVPTAGSITIGTNQLTVNNAAGWGVGMGIAVANAGTGGNTELITTITAMAGRTFTLATNAIASAPAGSSVNHDDTAALAGAMTTAMLSGAPMHTPVGNYNTTCAGLPSVTAPITFKGDGENATFIINRCANDIIIPISYGYPIPGTNEPQSALFEDFTIQQALNVTPTGGAAFSIATSGTPNYMTGLHINRVTIQNTWAGISTGFGLYKAWITNVSINYLVNGPAIAYNTSTPAGDVYFDNDALLGPNTGVTITQSDTITFTNLKVNGSQVLFNASAAANVRRPRFINPSIEGITGGPSCAVDFGASGITQATFEGGEIGGFANDFCNVANVVGGFSKNGLLEANSSFVAQGILDQNTMFYSAAGTVLPTCNANTKGTRAQVSDATAPTYLATYTSGGAVIAPVLCNGTNWITP